MRAIMLQFVKARSGNWGEVRAARRLGVEIVPLGAGFTWMSKDLEHDRALAREGWTRCRAAIESDAYDLVILDELTYCFAFGWLDLAEVLDVLRRRPRHAPTLPVGSRMEKREEREGRDKDGAPPPRNVGRGGRS